MLTNRLLSEPLQINLLIMALGKPKPHTAAEIRERREKVLLLMSRGYHQSDIAIELGTTRQTIIKDLKFINEMTNKGLFGLAKATSW